MPKEPIVIEVYHCIYSSKIICEHPCATCENYPDNNSIYCKNYPNKCMWCEKCEHYKKLFPTVSKKDRCE